MSDKFLFELFSGTGSVGRPWRDAGHRVYSVDVDGREAPEYCGDILNWDYTSHRHSRRHLGQCALRKLLDRTNTGQNTQKL